MEISDFITTHSALFSEKVDDLHQPPDLDLSCSTSPGYWAVCEPVFLDDENLDKVNLDYQHLDLSSYSHLTKAAPQVTVGKANKNYVNFWYETEQTGPAMLSTKL